MGEKEKTGKRGIDRRTFLKYGGALSATALTASVWPPAARSVEAATVEGATVEERAVNAAKAMKTKVDLNIMMWGQYSRGATQKLAAEFKEKTGIGFRYIDINVFMIPQRAVAEAMAKSGKIDIFHVDSTMVPTLARAGLAQPMDKWMKKGGHKIETVGPLSGHMRYRGENYALLTDGNVHTLFIRKDFFENPEERKKFQDKYGRPLTWPKTWPEYLDMIKFFTRPDKGFYGSGDIRGRKAGATFWWCMHFYSKGGFPFDDDMNPAIYNEKGIEATKEYIATRPAAPKEAPDWGTTQTIPFIRNGGIFACAYWDGLIQALQHPKSPTKGKWLFGVVPGSMVDGKLKIRAISSPVTSYVINRRGKNPEAAYWICQYLTGPKHSALVVGDPDNAFHDPWHPGHFEDPQIIKAYTPQGMKAIHKCLQVTSPSFLLPGFQEFNDLLDKNLADAFIGTISAEEAMKRTEKEWRSSVRRSGRRQLVKDLETYKAAMPTIDVPV
ncbi:MAG: substrate-binding domain-containing protein [Nitrospinota bacterium]